MATSISSSALVTLDEARAFLGFGASEEKDREGLLLAVINAVTVEVEGYVGQALKAAAGTEFYDGDGSNELILRRRPVDLSASFSLWVDSGRVFGATALLTRWDREAGGSPTSADYYVEADEGVVILLATAFPDLSSSAKVTYTAGYTAAAAPDLQMGILSEIREWWSQIDVDPSLGSFSGPGVGYSFRDLSLSSKTKRLLVPYSEMLK